MSGKKDPYEGLPVTFLGSAGPSTKERLSAADLEAKYLQMDKTRQDMLRDRRTPIPEAPKSPALKARETMMVTRAQEIAKNSAAKEFGLPTIEQNAKNAFQAAQQLLKHPGFTAATGLPNPFKGGFGVLNVPGTPAGDYGVALKSAVAEAFLPAFESLKGAGAISEFESKSALAGLANLGTGMSEAQMKREVQRYVDKIAQGVQNARKQAAMGGSPFSYEDLQRERARRAGRK